MTYLEALQGINAYPIPLVTITEVAERRNISLNANARQQDMLDRDYRLCRADLLLWLSIAPNVSQGGISYNFSEEQRKALKQQAQAIYDELEAEDAPVRQVKFGYKGSRL